MCVLKINIQSDCHTPRNSPTGSDILRWTVVNFHYTTPYTFDMIVQIVTSFIIISLCFSVRYKQLYKSVDFPSYEWKELYNYVCNDIVSDCNEREPFTVTINAINNVIKHLKPGKSNGFDGLSTDCFINGSPLLSEYVSCLCTCMLVPLHFQSLLWSIFRKDHTKI